MRTKEGYKEYLNLITQKRILQESLQELDLERNDLSSHISNVDNELKRYEKYDNITSEEVRELMSSVIFDSMERPAIFRMGGSTESPMDSFCKCSDYKEFTPFQKTEFNRMKPELASCQLELQSALITASELLPNYSVGECEGIAKWSNQMVRKHPRYEDLTSSQEAEIREIIYKFAKHTIE
jgi:hypothetical protein